MSGGAEATLAASRRDFAKAKVGHPVLWDRANANHKNYGVTEWPSAFLVGPNGAVFWQGDPMRLGGRPGERAEFRRRLAEQLDRAKQPAGPRAP